MTVDEFLQWDDGTDTRYELAGGQVRAMAAPGPAHQVILGNLAREIGVRLRSRPPCHVRIEVPLQISDETLWQADAAVVCGPAIQQPAEPTLLIEVHSPSTRRIDLGDKLDDYKQLPSVQEIWMVDSARRRAQVWRRVGERWMGEDHIGRSEFRSETVGGEPFVLDVIYENSGL
jgi:Uma2 family endonuclease